MRTRSKRNRATLWVETLENRRLLAVSRITLGDFADPDVLGFSAAELGSIGATDSLFTDFGISSISVSGSNSTDEFNVRPSSSRALWADDGGLRIVDPGTTGLLKDALSYAIEFASDQTRFGVGVHDEAGVYVLQLFSATTEVGQFAFSSGGDLTEKYIESSEEFRRVVVHYTSRTNDQGFALDNITIERQPGQPPEAIDDAITLDEDSGPIVINVLANDYDANDDLDPTSIKVETDPSNGEIEDHGDGTFTYTPRVNFHGTDGFAYTICNGDGLCDQANVAITVNSVLDVVVDVHPGKAFKRINVHSNAMLPVAILSTQTAAGELEDFDAALVNTSTIELNGVSAETRFTTVEDIDDDGDLDFILYFSVRELHQRGILDAGSVDVVLTGESISGEPLVGSDTIKVVSPRGGRGTDRGDGPGDEAAQGRRAWRREWRRRERFVEDASRRPDRLPLGMACRWGDADRDVGRCCRSRANSR